LARLRRIVLPGQAHVIIHRGHNGQDVFLDARDQDSYLSSLRDAATEAGVAVHAYGLFRHEVRLLATPRDEVGLGRMMQAVGRRFARLFNQRHGRTGTPWEGRFRSTVIEATAYFLACLRFVEGLSETSAPAGRAGDDAGIRSSAAHHLEGQGDPIAQAHPAYWALGNTPFEREAAYRQFASQPLEAPQVAAILHAAMHGWVLGSDAFAGTASHQARRKVRPSTPGRPRKTAD
jgi:putative transposase